MNMVIKGFARLFYHLARMCLTPLELVDPRLYMRVYIALLARNGMIFTGTPRYIATKARFDNLRRISIGDRVVISKYVIFLTHDYSLTAGLIAIGEAPATDVAVHRPITVGNNVFIGMGVIILPGTTIGDNVIIGAGSVIKGTIPSDSLVTGNPGQVTGTLTERADRWRQLRDGQYSSMDKS